MKSVSVAELKTRLSAFLSEVKAGEEILVRERSKPIARIVPLTHSLQEDLELAALAATGKLKLGEGELDDSFWDLPAPRIAPQALRRALELERDED